MVSKRIITPKVILPLPTISIDDEGRLVVVVVVVVGTFPPFILSDIVSRSFLHPIYLSFGLLL
jgi:hypothetical protein